MTVSTRVARVICLLPLICVLSSCLHFQSEEFSGSPDKILFARAMEAIDNGKYDVARLTLQTLINTYPDSEYAPKAKAVLQDPRLGFGCGSSGSIPPSDCGGDSFSNGNLTFFPE